MIYNLLSLINDNNGEQLSFGEACIYALIGFAIVFAGIVLIIFIIWLIGLIMRKTDNLAFLGKIKIGKKKKQTETATAPQTVNDGAEEVPAEVKAAIVAAIMAYYSEEAPKCEFKVKRIKRL